MMINVITRNLYKLLTLSSLFSNTCLSIYSSSPLISLYGHYNVQPEAKYSLQDS